MSRSEGGSEAIAAVVDGSAWKEFCQHIERAGKAVIESAPDDPFDRAEGLRYVSRIATHALRSFLERSDPAAPVFTNESPKMGGDNPDYVYGSARVSGQYEYRLRGIRGDADRLGIGCYSGGLGTPEGLHCDGYLSDAELEVQPDGRFEIVLSSVEQPGNWLPMKPETNQLMIRQTLLDRRNQRPAHFALERTDAADAPAPLDPAGFARALARAGGFAEGAIAQFLTWTNRFAQRPNDVRPLDPDLAQAAQGDPSTRYYFGYWELAPDEALAVELDPPRCDYWNFQICNHWLESLDFEHYTTHYNHRSATYRDDGSVRIVVAHRDPRVPNWIETTGHTRGCIALRWVNADRDSQPRCRVVNLSELAAS